MSDFTDCIDLTLEFEGGWSDHSDDKGGRTKFGISSRAFPEVDLDALTIEQAKDIYRKNYWDAVHADKLPEKIRHVVFDCAVHSGVTRAIKFMQRALTAQGFPIHDDGVIGPITLKALDTCDSMALATQILGLRLKHMSDLSSWESFSRGWARRVASLLKELG